MSAAYCGAVVCMRCLSVEFSHGPIWGHIPALSHRRGRNPCAWPVNPCTITAWGNWIVLYHVRHLLGVILAHRTTRCHFKYNRINCKNNPEHCGEIPGCWYGAFNMRLPGAGRCPAPRYMECRQDSSQHLREAAIDHNPSTSPALPRDADRYWRHDLAPA